jgi:imidazolonepropionase-like amidohydrolase
MQQRTVFTHAHLLDGKHACKPDMTVVIEGDKIISVGKEAPVQEGERRINLDGKTLMPGMTVGHWHGEFVDIGPPLFGPGRSGTFLGEEKPPAILALQYANALRAALMSGVTQVISASCAHNHDMQMKLAVESGLIAGPNVTPCSRHVVTTSDHEDRGRWWSSTGPLHDGIRRRGANVFADGVSEMVKAVRQEILFGAEIIKILPSGGHGFAWSPRYRGLSNAEMRAVVQTAHERDKRVRAHVSTREAILESIEAGVDIIDHADYLDEECIEKMLKHGTFFGPSMLFTKIIGHLKTDTPNDLSDADQRGWLNMLDMLPKANKAGLKIVPGDDFGALGLPHQPGIYARELEVYVNDMGIPALDVLRWATANGAEMALLGAVTGTIEAGKLADMLVVDADPVADIGVLTQPARYLKAVVQNGRFVKDELAANPLNKR